MRTRLARSAQNDSGTWITITATVDRATSDEGGLVADAEVVADIGQQHRERRAVELVDGVEAHQHAQREHGPAERDRGRAPLLA